MMQDWNKYRDALVVRAAEFGKENPEVPRGMAALQGAAEKSGTLEPKIHELIALAVAVTTRCDGCISVHVKKAVEFGATKQEITEALSVAIALNAGAAMVYSSRVLEARAQLENL
ncbi:carboxymuconolactone decarboxylase family protein [Paraburkholderia sp. JHI869]|uniref:carboxymuconolactone decarboxylase family protein n=1 Tax=Paraburkholderia sp. JHI869 TaxID=3112959 RepID=UPI00316D455D